MPCEPSLLSHSSALTTCGVAVAADAVTARLSHRAPARGARRYEDFGFMAVSFRKNPRRENGFPAAMPKPFLTLSARDGRKSSDELNEDHDAHRRRSASSFCL